MPRPRYQAYREQYEEGPSLITCAVYFITLIVIGGAVMFLLIHVFTGSV